VWWRRFYAEHAEPGEDIKRGPIEVNLAGMAYLLLML
jgi:hypothetical protein